MDKSDHPQTKSSLALNYIVTSLCFLDTHLLVPIIALYASALGAGVGMIGLIVGLYSLINTPANIFFGQVIDRVGYKRPLIIGLLGDAIFMFCYAICRLPFHLALVRSFHGLTGGLAGPATMSITAENAAKDEKGKSMGFYGMSLGMASLVGYGLSGVMASRLGYNSVFYLGSGLLLLGMLLALAMPKSKFVAATKVRTPPRAQLKKIGALFRRKELTASYCSVFAQYFAFGGIVTLLPLFIRGLGMEVFHMGMLLTTFVIMFILVQFPSGVLSDKVGRRLPIAAGLSLSIISLAILPQFRTFTSLAIIMALYGAAHAMLFPAISASVADSTSAQERGMATGIFHALLTGSIALGAPFMGWVATQVGLELGLALSSGILVLALIIISINLRHRPVYNGSYG